MQDKEQCRCQHCKNLFRQYLEKIAETEPAIKEKYPVNLETGKLPDFEERFEKLLLWKYYMDFVQWQRIHFFKSIEEEVTEAGYPMGYILFYHSRMYWPGGGAWSGISPYYAAQVSPVIMNEFCHSRFPIAKIASAWDDRMSREYGRGIWDMSWFWSGYQDGPGVQVSDEAQYDLAIARKMGHELHGLIFYLYSLPVYNHLPVMTRKFSYWHNFFSAHWDFLKNAEVAKPEIAVLFPGYAAYFYKQWRYNKADFGWGPQALIEAQYPFTVLQDEEVETGKLKGYKLLYVFGAERTSKKVINEISDFIEKGGYVFADADSLFLDLEGQKTGMLEKYFGISPERKYKTPFWPSVLDRREELDDTWLSVKDSAEKYQVPPLSTSGFQQEKLNPDSVNILSVSPGIVPSGSVRTYHDVVTGRILAGKALAQYNGQTAAVETDRTVWFGNRPGFDIYATYPWEALVEMGETRYSEGMQHGWYNLDSPEKRADYRNIVTYIAEKAGIKKPALVIKDGMPAVDVEAAVKTDTRTGAKMIFLVNQGKSAGPVRLEVPGIKSRSQAIAMDMEACRSIKMTEPGILKVAIKPESSLTVFIGPSAQVGKIAAAHEKLVKMDLAPGKFTVGPKFVDEPPVPEVNTAEKVETGNLAPGAVAEIRVKVVNRDKQNSRTAEPVVIPADRFASRLQGCDIKGVRLDGDIPVQWDDIDKNGVLSEEDEIAWQADLAPGEEKLFNLRFLDKPAENSPDKNFRLRVSGNEGSFIVNNKNVFCVNTGHQWIFPLAPGRARSQSGASFFRGAMSRVEVKLKEPVMEVISDGPVRKSVVLRHGYEPFKDYFGIFREPDITTQGRYTVYSRNPESGNRVFASITHHFNETYRFEPRGDLGVLTGYTLAALDPGTFRDKTGWYVDTLGRISPAKGSEIIEKNCGGWLAGPLEDGSVLGILLRRTKGITRKLPVPDEQDGVQVLQGTLSRSFINWNASDINYLVDKEISKGNEYRLDCMLIHTNGGTPQDVESLRRTFASPPEIKIEEVLVAKRGFK